MRTSKAFAEFRDLYVKDVEEHPECYKPRVRAAPHSAADIICHSLNAAEIRKLTADLRRERRAVERAKG